MTTERLSALAILSTEVDLALFIDLDDFYTFFSIIKKNNIV